jgi:Cu/Ag efflux protein CusF
MITYQRKEKDMNRNSILIAALFLGAGLPFHAGADASHMQLAQAATAASAEWSAGEVKKVDKEAGKVTIKHGALPKLDMPPMIMSYRVKDNAMLDQLQPGDKIKFDVERAGEKYTVTGIEKVK